MPEHYSRLCRYLHTYLQHEEPEFSRQTIIYRHKYRRCTYLVELEAAIGAT